MEIDKELFEKALGYYTCNASEVVDNILDKDDWENVVLWEPFENWETEDIYELVYDLYRDFVNIKKEL